MAIPRIKYLNGLGCRSSTSVWKPRHLRQRRRYCRSNLQEGRPQSLEDEMRVSDRKQRRCIDRRQVRNRVFVGIRGSAVRRVCGVLFCGGHLDRI